MPVSRFALYFVALAACSTIAFASGLSGKVAVHDSSAALEAASARPLTPAQREAIIHRHSLLKMALAAPKTVSLARAD